MNRRSFIKRTSLLTLMGGIGLPALSSSVPSRSPGRIKLRFGICTDLHYDLMPDGLSRIKKFIAAMNEVKADFVVQLGDFCKCYDYNTPLLDEWNKFNGPGYHVLGNHDMDGGFSKDQVVSFWNSPGGYYSFEKKGFHFIVLDGNEGQRTESRRYPSMFSERQLTWLEQELVSNSLPTLVFIHQALDSDTGVQNASKVRHLLDDANRNSPTKKVHAVFSGHHHLDYHNEINGIQYIQINSMSNHFIGKKHKAPSFSEEILLKTPKLLEVAPYRDPLWALVEIHEDGDVAVTGQKSEFIGLSPRERGQSRWEDIPQAVPFISDRHFTINLSSESIK